MAQLGLKRSLTPPDYHEIFAQLLSKIGPLIEVDKLSQETHEHYLGEVVFHASCIHCFRQSTLRCYCTFAFATGQ